jgi:hypothetical protein
MDEREEMRDVLDECRRWGDEGRDSEFPMMVSFFFVCGAEARLRCEELVSLVVGGGWCLVG